MKLQTCRQWQPKTSLQMDKPLTVGYCILSQKDSSIILVDDRPLVAPDNFLESGRLNRNVQQQHKSFLL